MDDDDSQVGVDAIPHLCIVAQTSLTQASLGNVISGGSVLTFLML